MLPVRRFAVVTSPTSRCRRPGVFAALCAAACSLAACGYHYPEHHAELESPEPEAAGVEARVQAEEQARAEGEEDLIEGGWISPGMGAASRLVLRMRADEMPPVYWRTDHPVPSPAAIQLIADYIDSLPPSTPSSE